MTFAPVPEFARGPDIPDAGYLVTDLGGGAYGITSGSSKKPATRTGLCLTRPSAGLGAS
jgi:hypothetical protein